MFSDDLFDSYISSSPNWSAQFNRQEFEGYAENYKRSFGSIVPEDKSAVILDIGCGKGQFLYFLKKEGYQDFVGIDISPQQVDFCRKYITSNVVIADLMDYLQGRQLSYDFVTMHDVLEHVPKERILSTLRVVHTSLRKGGRLMVQVPNMENPFNLYSRYADFTHELGFTPNSLEQVLKAIGFRKVAVYATGHFIPPNGGIKATIKSWAANFARKLILKGLYYLFQIPDHPREGGAPKIQYSKRIFAVADKGEGDV